MERDLAAIARVPNSGLIVTGSNVGIDQRELIVTLVGSVAGAVIMTILPSLVSSTRTISTPAERTAFTALVTSACRNVDSARAMASYRRYGRADANSGRPVKASPSGPTVCGPRRSRRG